MTAGCGTGHTNRGALPSPHPAARRPHLIYTPKRREAVSYLIGMPSPSRGGRHGRGHCLDFHAMNWWTLEFVVVDVGATLVLLLGYLALMIRKAVL